MVTLIEEMHAALLRAKATVATAESCTGGILATWLTELPGSSAYYLGGVSAYSNSVKERMLGVPSELLAEHGAVSAPVAEAMAEGARVRLGATLAVSLTGIAGPDGGTTAKPVGTVYCGIASPRGVRSVLLQLSGERRQVREAAARRALDELRKDL